MKKLLLLILISSLFSSCLKDDLTFGTDGDSENYVILSGDLNTQTLTKGVRYLLKGQVFVKDTKVLTIEAGSVIFGDKATKGTLIISPGGKLIAQGTAAQPIVFTSSQTVETRDRGDWGGLVILGKAQVNQTNPAIEGINPPVIYGGTDDADNSGILKYVRVEYAGIELTPNNETNSITLGGVGSATVMEYCQVSYGGDDGFELFGGTINGKYLISLGMWDDDYDIDFGYRGKIQFALAVRYPTFADQSGSNIVETDNGPNDNVTSLITNGVLTNLTAIGPRLTNTQVINANYQHSIDMRRRTSLTIANSVFVGMIRGIRMNQQSVFDNYNSGAGSLLNNIMSAPASTFTVGTGMTATATSVQNYWNANGNVTVAGTDFENPTTGIYNTLGLDLNIFYGSSTQNFYSFNPTFEVTSGTLTTGASFTNPKLTDAFFTPTTYRGAFGSSDWTATWAEFVPNLKAY